MDLLIYVKNIPLVNVMDIWRFCRTYQYLSTINFLGFVIFSLKGG